MSGRGNMRSPHLAKGRARKAGLPPGTLVHVGERKLTRTVVTLIDYNESRVHEREIKSVEELAQLRANPNSVTWINVEGLEDVGALERIGSLFGLHPLVLEDILNTNQRPKLEDYGEYLYIVVRMLYCVGATSNVTTEQVSIVLGSGFVLSYQEGGGDVFGPIRDRIRSDVGRIRKVGADFLAYSLLDAVVDNYFVVLERLGDRVEFIEDVLTANSTPATLQEIHKLRREMILLRKAVWPLREVIASLQRGDSPLIQETTSVYLRDVYDHTVEVMDTIETLRDMLADMLDVYLSSISNRLNEVMKVLTVISTIFIPLTFVAGVYGMNFEYIPELRSPWGYPAVLGLMLAIALTMLVYFRRRRWL